MKFSYSQDKNIIVVDSINILTILNFLRERSFIIEEMRDLDNNLIYRDDGKGFLKDDEVIWIDENQGIEINSIIKLIWSKNGLGTLNVKFSNNDFLVYSNNQLVVYMTDQNKLKDLTVEMLKYNGLFISNLIWDICEITKITLSLSSLLGLDYNEVGDKLSKVFNQSKIINE